MKWWHIAAVSMLAASPSFGDVHALVLRGMGGEPEFDQKFDDWTSRLNQALQTRLYVPAENVVMVGGATGASLDEIERTVQEMAGRIGPEDTWAIFLIGHGSYQRTDAKLNLEGPDLTADQLAAWLDEATYRNAAIINCASTSAAFINALSAPDRIVCSATKSVEERNATELMEYIIQALEDGSADSDRDGRISVYELCHQAAVLTEASYTAEGFIASEHALLDDNGDRLGTRLVLDDGAEPAKGEDGEAAGALDGALSAKVYLTETLFQGAPPALLAAYEAAMVNVEAHIAAKASFENGEAYYAELERLLLEAATAQSTLREAAAANEEDGS